MSWLLQVLIAINQLANALLAGWADETLSARAWRQRHKPRWQRLMRVTDAVFGLFGQVDHCRQAYETEVWRRQSPPQVRPLAPPAGPAQATSSQVQE